MEFSAKHGFPVVQAVQETGSGLHGCRKALLRRNPEVQVIVVVEHGDRLMRLGFAYLEAALAARGRRVLVVEDSEITDDLVRDRQEGMVSRCARWYDQRAAQKRAKKAIPQCCFSTRQDPQ